MDHIMEIVDPEIIDADLYKLQNELSFLEVQNQVSKLFLEEQKKYLQELQKSQENSDSDTSDEDEMVESFLLMQNNLQKLYEEFLSIPTTSDAQNNLVKFVKNIESSFFNRGLEFDRHLKNYELLCEKQENSEELQRLNQMQEDLDAETAKLNLLLIEQKQLDKLQAEKEKQEFKELQKCIIELAAFAIKAKRHEEQNMTVEKLENELSILEAKKKELIDHEDDYLNDNNIVQVERCQFESFFKDPNDFPYLKSLKKIEDEKIFKVPFDIKYPEIHDENAVVESIPKLQNQSSKRARRSKQALTSTYIKPVLISSPKKVIKQQSVDTSKSNTLIITKKSTSKDLTRISPILNVLNSPNNVKAAPKKQEVLTDKIPVNKSRVCSVNDASQDLNNLSSIDDALQQVEPVQTLPQKTSKPIIYSSTPKRPKIIDDSKNAKIVRISVDSPVTAKVRNLSPSNKANIVSVEILPHPTVETKLSPQSNIALRSSNRRLLSQEIVTQTEAIKKSFQTEQTLLVNNDNKKKTDEIKVIVETPKEMIWKSPPQKTLNDGKALSISDCCSETSDNEHIFNDDFDICSVKSGNGSELNFLSPNSNRSFNMDTVENDNAEVNTKDAFDFGSFPESEECAGGSLF